jgi:hypothetical protein
MAGFPGQLDLGGTTLARKCFGTLRNVGCIAAPLVTQGITLDNPVCWQVSVAGRVTQSK